MNRILIIQTAFLGDVILATPLASELARQFPNALIDVMAIPIGSEVWKNNPNVRNTIIYDKNYRDKGVFGLWKIIKRIKLERYDWIISPHRSLRSAIISYFSGAVKRTTFDKSSGANLFYTDQVVYRAIHEIERNLSLIQEDYSKDKIPEIYPDKNEIKKVENILMDHRTDNSYIAMAPGSVWNTKRWPENKFLAVCHILADDDIQVVLIGGKSDKDLCERISQNSTNCIDLSDQLNIRESYEVIKKSKCLVTNDSAPLHLGSAARTPTVAIFGATVPEFGFGPYGNEKSVVLGANGLDCRPCGIHGGKSCPIKTFDCMLHITPYQVVEKIKEILNNANS